MFANPVFKNSGIYISNKYAVSNFKLDHFTIHRTF